MAENIEEITGTMEEAMKGVLTAEVTYAVRDTTMSGIEVHTGDHIGIADKRILSDGETRVKAATELLSKLDMEDKEVLILIAGKDATREDVDEVRAFIKKSFPFTEIFEIDGKQEVYSFIFIAE